MIIPKKVIDTSNDDDDDDEEDEDDDFESDEDESDEDEDDNKTDDEYNPYREIKDIKKKLDLQKVIYEYRELEGAFRKRIFHDMFKDFKHKYKQNIKDNNQAKKPKNGKELNNFDIPHRNRICIVVDRRKGGDSKNEIYVYKPNVLGDVPDGNLPEWYFQSSFTSIIPGKQQTDTISAKSPCHGMYDLLCH